MQTFNVHEILNMAGQSGDFTVTSKCCGLAPATSTSAGLVCCDHGPSPCSNSDELDKRCPQCHPACDFTVPPMPRLQSGDPGDQEQYAGNKGTQSHHQLTEVEWEKLGQIRHDCVM